VRVKNSAARFNIVCSNDRDENIRITCDMLHKTYSIDRTRSSSSGFSTHFFGVHTAPFLGEEAGSIEFELYFDRTSVECIACGGLLSITDLVFPAEPFSRVELSAPDDVVLVEKITLRGIHHESTAAW
jgi:fructan beta-fructosidase